MPSAVRSAARVNMVVQIERMRDGKRRVVSIVEVCGMEEDVIQTQELYNYRIKIHLCRRDGS